MKRICSSLLVMLVILAGPQLFAQQNTNAPFNSSDAYLKFILAKKHNQRNIIDLDSIHELSHGANGYNLAYRHLHTSDYTSGIFSKLTLWDVGAGWTNLEMWTFEADTAAYQVRYTYHDSYWPGYGWFPIPFVAGLIQYDAMFREIYDSLEMAQVNYRFFSEYFYDVSGRRIKKEGKRSAYNFSTQMWGPKHYFDSLGYHYHGNTDSLELISRYFLVTPYNTVQTWYTYQNKLVVLQEDSNNLSGSFTESSLTRFFYDQDDDMVIRLYRQWNDSAQAYRPYDSIVYHYYSPPLAQFFYVDWLVSPNYPDFGVATKLIREIERFSYHPVDGYRPSWKFIYYYNVPGLEASKVTTPDVVTSLYPNPATDHIMVHHNLNGQQCMLELYSTDGRLITSTPLHDTSTRVNTDNLRFGLYLYRIISGNAPVDSGKFVIAR